ncbi:hypothetical protein FDP41_006826 [Naegleria fowleri]|uniref:Uncharacterized protein n=1 Tax=Naegleria fowleri TaxID=5763 RepID=A0A6A5BHM3_NAEFO|nr:uncharacterized protein FDP41_006826 [Naegleria fowleri]KAF0974216.1 hypothetical protein FDP41_006826 [Naegleria fowleri]CAG4717609.1 unnamed protein product [Naegleria fowleri]
MANHIRESQAWKERCMHEDKAALSFINSYILAREMSNNSPVSKGPNNIPPGFKPKALPHLLEPIEKKSPSSINNNNNNGDLSNRSSRVSEDDSLSVRSYKSNASSISNGSRSGRSDRSNRSSALDEESKRKIDMLEKSLNEERKGRLEVQQELESLKQLIKENLKK